MSSLRLSSCLTAVALVAFCSSACAVDGEAAPDDGGDDESVAATAEALSTSCSGWNNYGLEPHTIDGPLGPAATLVARTRLQKNGSTAKAYVEYTIRSGDDDFSRFDVRVELQRRNMRISLDKVVRSVTCHVASRANEGGRTGEPQRGTCALPAIPADDGYYSADGRVDATWEEGGLGTKSDYEKFQGSPLVKF